jgi:hypothetical protein
VWFAVVAVQNPSFAPVAVLPWTLGIFRHGWRLLARDWARLGLFAAILLSHPLYYLIRDGWPTPKFSTTELVFSTYFFPLKHMAAFWIDPDAGLLTNWPLALPLLLAGTVLAWRRPSRRVREFAVFASLATVILTWSFTRISLGFGGGGATVGLSRYAVWMVFLFFPIQWQVLEWLGCSCRVGRAERAPPKQDVGSWWGSLRSTHPTVCAATTAGIVLACWTVWLFWPTRAEVSRRPTPLSKFLCANLPGVYDPVPRIFYACYGGTYDFELDDWRPWASWAVSDPSGNKVFVWSEVMRREDPRRPAPIAGCPQLDPLAVYRLAEERFRREPAADHIYINGMGALLRVPSPAASSQFRWVPGCEDLRTTSERKQSDKHPQISQICSVRPLVLVRSPSRQAPRPKTPLKLEMPKSVDQLHPALGLLSARPHLFRKQGSVAAAWRRCGGRAFGPYCRLSYREDSRQESLYLGRAGQLVDKVRQMLGDRQRLCRQSRAIDQCRRRIAGQMRGHKQRLDAGLHSLGPRLQGFEIRGLLAKARAVLGAPARSTRAAAFRLVQRTYAQVMSRPFIMLDRLTSCLNCVSRIQRLG